MVSVAVPDDRKLCQRPLAMGGFLCIGYCPMSEANLATTPISIGDAERAYAMFLLVVGIAQLKSVSAIILTNDVARVEPIIFGIVGSCRQCCPSRP